MAPKKRTTKKTSVKKHTTKRVAKHVHVGQQHGKKHAPKDQPKTTALIIGGAIILGFLFVMMNYSVMDMDKKTYTTATNPTLSLSADEKAKIKQWIIDENLNAYGDKKGTMYIGGTPLFDESTGKYKDLNEYILEQHPDRPWNN